MQEIASVEDSRSTLPVEFRRRYRIRRRRPLHDSKGDTSRRLGRNYVRLYNRHVNEVEGTLDGLLWAGKRNSHAPLDASHIGGVYWSSHEKEIFFHSLARRGRRNVDGLVRDLRGFKSTLEVAAYLDVLARDYEARLMEASKGERGTRASSRRLLEVGLLPYHALPMAQEVSDSTARREGVLSRALRETLDARDEATTRRKLGWSRIDSVSAAEISRQSEDMTEQQLDLLTRIAPDLVLFDFSALVASSSSTTTGTRASVIDRDTTRGLYDLLHHRLKTLMGASVDVARVRLHVEADNAYFSQQRFRHRHEVSAVDVQVANHAILPRSVQSPQEQEDDSDGDDGEGEDVADHKADEEVEEDVMSETSDEESENQELEKEELKLLNRHDDRLDIIHENAHRPYLGLKTTLPVPQAPTFAQITKLLRHDWRARQVVYQDVQIDSNLE